MKSTAFVLLALGSVLLLSGCPSTGIVCAAGTVRCGSGCIDPVADTKNCGACGAACRLGQLCSMGVCTCGPGSKLCNGECVVTETDPSNCGRCGNSCTATQVCQESSAGAGGTCSNSCPLTGASTLCGASCVNLGSNALHCGACGAACENQQTCRAGRCSYDLVAACFSSGQVIGMTAETELRGPLAQLGTGPQSLASMGGILLSVDGIDQKLYQARITSVGGAPFGKVAFTVPTGSIPNQVIVDPPYAYVVNSGSGTLQILINTVPDGGLVADGGFALSTIREVVLGANTYPQGLAKVGNVLWVPLYGGVGAGAASAGQKVVGIDVSDPFDAGMSRSVSLSGIDLKPFDGGTPVARPYAITTHRGSVYVALNNLNPDTYRPQGPGLLAKINPATGALTVIDLGADRCLNPGWLGSDGTRLLVSCIGAASYSGPPTYALVKTEKSGVVLLDENDVPQSVWEPTCPAGADGGPGCAPILPSRFAVRGGRLYVGDQNGGRLFVLDISGNSLLERRGYFGFGGNVIPACPPDPVTGIANVSDVLAVP